MLAKPGNFWQYGAFLMVTVLVGLVGVVSVLTADDAKPSASELPVVPAKLGSCPIDLEVASQPREIGFGLMHRAFLPDNRGMLFVFPEGARLSFWMKNTLIDLDIAFFDRNWALLRVDARTAGDLALKEAPEGSAYAIEVNLGKTAACGLLVGDRLEPPL